MSTALKLASVLTLDEYEHILPLLQQYQAARNAAIEERRRAAEPAKQARAQSQQLKLEQIFNDATQSLKVHREGTKERVECRVVAQSETELKAIGVVDGKFKLLTARRVKLSDFSAKISGRVFGNWVFTPRSLKLTHPEDAEWFTQTFNTARPFDGVTDLDLRRIRSLNHPDKGGSVDIAKFQAAVKELDRRRAL